MTSGMRWIRAWAILACVGGVGGCAPAGSLGGSLGESHDWHGYFYENVLVNDAPAVSAAFTSAQACVAAMRQYTLDAPRWAGFACARDCSAPGAGYLADCREVER